MGVIGSIVIGFLVGLVARVIKPGDDRMGLILTTVVGISGAIVGTYLGQMFGFYQEDEATGFIGAVVGAVLVLALLKTIFNRK